MHNLLRILILIACLMITFGVTMAASAETQSAPNSPNIVLVLADDMSWFDVGAYHQSSKNLPQNAITPNIDQLAREGMLFTQSFTATAMCTVTRSQLYTGLYPVRNGAYGNHTRVYDHVKSVAHYFRDLGYRVGLAGKGHIFPSKSFPFIKAGKENKGALGESSFGIEETRKFLTRNKEKPFFLIVASSNPHTPWNRGDTDHYQQDKLQVPVFLDDTKGLRKQLSEYLAEVSDLDREVGLLEAEIEMLGIKNDTIFIFTSEQGSSLPFGKWTNYDSGLQTAFIVRWPNNVKAGSVSNALIEYVDVVPTLIDVVSNNAPENMDGKSFKSVLMGEKKEHKDYVYGIQTSLNIHDGAAYPIRSIRSKSLKLIHNLMPEGEFSSILTNSSWFKAELQNLSSINGTLYARYLKRPEYELYDIVKDPFEQKNIIDMPGYGDEVAILRSKLSSWMDQQGDQGVGTELSVCERKGFSHKRCP